MATPTDLIKKVESASATFLPGYDGATLLEFAVIALQAGGGMETGMGEDVTSSADYVAGVAVAKMGGSRKITHKPFTVEAQFSPTQDAALKLAMGENGRGTWEVTFVDGSKRSNASVDLIDVDIASDTVSASGSLSITMTFQPSGDAEWVNTPAT
jgi:hypothetical protein